MDIHIFLRSLPKLLVRYWNKQPSGQTLAIVPIVPWQLWFYWLGWIFRSRLFSSQLWPLQLVDFPKSFVHQSMFLKGVWVSIWYNQSTETQESARLVEWQFQFASVFTVSRNKWVIYHLVVLLVHTGPSIISSINIILSLMSTNDFLNMSKQIKVGASPTRWRRSYCVLFSSDLVACELSTSHPSCCVCTFPD